MFHQLICSFITVRNEVWGKVIFSEVCVKNSVDGGGGVVSQHALQVVSQHAFQVSRGWWYPSTPCRSPGPHPGGKLRGLAWGGLQAHIGGVSPGPHPEGGIPACTEADPPNRRPLLRAVRILLECILVLLILLKEFCGCTHTRTWTCKTKYTKCFKIYFVSPGQHREATSCREC